MNRKPAQGIARKASRLLSAHAARAKRDGQTLDYASLHLQRLLEAHPLCGYCRMPLDLSASLDHRQPIARGGKHSLDNLLVCCTRCNRLKGQLTEGEFHQLATLLAAIHPVARQDVERRLLAGGARYGRR